MRNSTQRSSSHRSTEIESVATQRCISIVEIQELAERFEDRGRSVIPNDQPEGAADIRLASALLRRLSQPTTFLGG
jgi:hypothetical protein